MSVVTFTTYGFDKIQAKRANRQRIPEMVLHLFALAGGVAGAWLGRVVFHHKTLQIKFTLVLFVATILHLGFLFFFVL